MTSKSGEGLVSFALGSTVFTLAFSVVAILSFSVFAQSLFYLDIYRLARAHLYGNESHFCRPSQLWPESYRDKFRFHCSGNGVVEGYFTIDVAGLAWKFQRKVDLRRGAAQ